MNKLLLGVCALALLAGCRKAAEAPAPQTGPVAAVAASAPDPMQDVDPEFAAERAAVLASGAIAEQAAAEAGVPGAGVVAAPEDPALPVIDYKRTLLPLIAGAYGGDCVHQIRDASGKAVQTKGGAIVVTANGDVGSERMDGHSLLGVNAVLELTRDGAPGQPAGLSFAASGDEGNWFIAVMSRGQAELQDRRTVSSVTCPPQPRRQVSGLFALVESHFKAAARPMRCAQDGGQILWKKVGPMSNGVMVGKEMFSFSGNKESLSVASASQALNYGAVDYEGKGASISLKLSARGRLLDVKITGKANYVCGDDPG